MDDPGKIPIYVQVLHRHEPETEERDKLIIIYEDGGKKIDEEMKLRNPNAKRKLMFVSVGNPEIRGTKAKFSTSQSQGYWIYCGNLWYVRKVEDEYHFAQYMTYHTDNKEILGLWDAREHEKK